LIAAVATNWQAFLPTAPVVEVDGLDAAPPLWSAFYIRNESFIFPLRITWLGCRIITIEPATTTKGDVDLWVGTRACRQLSQMIAAARWMAARKLRAVLS
jgi:hypothetical protein